MPDHEQTGLIWVDWMIKVIDLLGKALHLGPASICHP